MKSLVEKINESIIHEGFREKFNAARNKVLKLLKKEKSINFAVTSYFDRFGDTDIEVKAILDEHVLKICKILEKILGVKPSEKVYDLPYSDGSYIFNVKNATDEELNEYWSDIYNHVEREFEKDVNDIKLNGNEITLEVMPGIHRYYYIGIEKFDYDIK